MLHFKPGGVNSIIQVTDLNDMPKRESLELLQTRLFLSFRIITLRWLLLRRKRELLLVSEYMPNGITCLIMIGRLSPGGEDSPFSKTSHFNGRLGDFGMSRLYDRGTDPTTTAAVGTVGYMAPELTTMGPCTGTDVYAFGVFLLEVTCGRRPVEPGLTAAKRYLIKWVCECWKKIDAIDPRLTEFSSQEIERVLKVGLLCANLAPDARPSMEQMVQYLNGNIALPEFWPYSPGIGAHSNGVFTSTAHAPFTITVFFLIQQHYVYDSLSPLWKWTMKVSNNFPYHVSVLVCLNLVQKIFSVIVFLLKTFCSESSNHRQMSGLSCTIIIQKFICKHYQNKRV